LKDRSNDHSEYGLKLSHCGQADFDIVQVEWWFHTIDGPVRISRAGPVQEDSRDRPHARAMIEIERANLFKLCLGNRHQACEIGHSRAAPAKKPRVKRGSD
jgi:hypothetical protein